jgi:glycosyltransferase involved in cell wall biosynthesis
MERKTITFVLGKFPNPRIKKRIELEKEIGTVSLICWNMGGINYNFYEKDVEIYSIDVKANRTNPLKRIIPTLKFMNKSIKRLFELSPQILHVENIDMLFVSIVYYFLKSDKPKIIYEVADLHNLIVGESNTIVRKAIKKCLRWAEKKMCKRISFLIITSERFYDVYYKQILNKEKVIFMPNMPDLKAFNKFKKKDNGTFTIGFVGSIRYYDQMKLLIEASHNKEVNLIFAGFSHNKKFYLEFEDRSDIDFIGQFDYDNDIAEIYSKLDCVYSVYDADDNNVKVALPNKLYEAIYCELPIIVAKGTYLSEIVTEMGVGVSISHNSQEELEMVIDKLSKDTDFYNEIIKNCKKHKNYVNVSKYNSTLIDKIQKI